MCICEICGQKVKKLVIDHNHETGYIRGFICQKCNSWLYFVEKNKIHNKKIADWYYLFKETIDKYILKNTGVLYKKTKKKSIKKENYKQPKLKGVYDYINDRIRTEQARSKKTLEITNIE